MMLATDRWGRVPKLVLGLLLMGAGLWFAFLHSRTPDGHFDHTALYIGVGVALFGALMVTPGTVREAVSDAKVIIGKRLSGQQPEQKDGE
jgi:hypothetical protein